MDSCNAATFVALNAKVRSVLQSRKTFFGVSPIKRYSTLWRYFSSRFTEKNSRVARKMLEKSWVFLVLQLPDAKPTLTSNERVSAIYYFPKKTVHYHQKYDSHADKNDTNQAHKNIHNCMCNFFCLVRKSHMFWPGLKSDKISCKWCNFH